MKEAGTAEAWKSDVIRAGEEHRPSAPWQGPLRITINFYLPRPQRLMRKKDRDGPLPCLGHNAGDVDNLAKAVMDALQTDGWFRDDSQIWRATVTKEYHGKGDHPGASIWIQETDE